MEYNELLIIGHRLVSYKRLIRALRISRLALKKAIKDIKSGKVPNPQDLAKAKRNADKVLDKCKQGEEMIKKGIRR